MFGLFPIPYLPYHPACPACPLACPPIRDFLRAALLRLRLPHHGGFPHLHSLVPFGMGLGIRGAPFRPGAPCTPSVFLVCPSGQAGRVGGVRFGVDGMCEMVCNRAGLFGFTSHRVTCRM